MNKLKKIGLSALAGSLVAFSANAAELSVSGGAGFAYSSVDEGNADATFYQFDSVVLSGSGTTENGINVAVKFELDGGANTSGTSSSYDDQMMSVGTDTFGTLEFWGHGGSAVMAQWDDRTPTAAEEVWDVGFGNNGTEEVAANRINGNGSGGMFNYTSPTIQGVTVKASYTSANTTDDKSHYNDWGVQVQPEMLDGLTVWYAAGTVKTGDAEADEETYGFTYAYGPVTIGYQESESDDDTTNTNDDELESMSIAYAVNDNLSISYGEREYDHDTTQTGTDGSETQKDSGFGVSYTMGGVSIYGQFNETENNNGGTAAHDDIDHSEIGISFAF